MTPSVGAATDIAPLGRTQPRPAHELTAAEEAQVTDWNKVAAMEEFRALLKAKLRFIAPATAFFAIYYFALPVLVGYAPELMGKKIFGAVNLAYLFALSQFVMAWVIAALYVRAAGRFDKMAEAILAKLKFK
ncbi:MAG TPA: DUF485 domain-containing protein [Verrucomicrobiae bacterium]|nr:DUF485 domain-containing protein [Verrucomicrobiae bacterium]